MNDQVLNSAVDSLTPPTLAAFAQGMKLPRGVRNNNPGNVVASKRYAWRGQVGVDPSGKVIMSAPVFGIRMMGIVIVNYIEHHGLRSIRDVIERWSADPEPIRQNYADYVSRETGVDATTPYPYDTAGWVAIKAMIGFENATPWHGSLIREFYSDALIQRGVGLSHER